MTCVFDPARALCQMHGSETGDHRRTPDLDDCRPACRNIARTDRDIDAVRLPAEELQKLVEARSARRSATTGSDSNSTA